MTEIAEPVAVDLGLQWIIIGLGGLLLGVLGYIIGRAIQVLIGHIPLVGGWVATAVEDAIVKPSLDLFHGSEARLTRGLHTLSRRLGEAALFTLAAMFYTQSAFEYLRHHLIPNLVNSVSGAVARVAHNALSLAKTAEHDAQRALSKVEHIAIPTSAEIWKDIRGEVRSVVQADVAPVAKEASAVSTEVAHAVGGAAAELPRLPGLGYDELNKLLGEADLTKLAGLLAAVPLLNSLIQSLTQEAGLTSAECRSKVGGICGVNPSAWEGLLASLAVAAFAFDLPAIVKAVDGLAPAATKIVKEAA